MGAIKHNPKNDFPDYAHDTPEDAGNTFLFTVIEKLINSCWFLAGKFIPRAHTILAASSTRHVRCHDKLAVGRERSEYTDGKAVVVDGALRHNQIRS